MILLVVASQGCRTAGPLPQVQLSRWTAPDHGVHEVAIWRRMSHDAPTTSRAAKIDRVYVVPGSGCAGIATLLPHYFSSLPTREVVVLHKRHTHAADWPAPRPCPVAFTLADHLPTWRQAWQQFLDEDLTHRPVRHEHTVLVGISEGAELLPALQLQGQAPGLRVLLASPGLDPWQALQLHLAQENDPRFLHELQTAMARPVDTDDPVAQPWVGGRTTAYWRAMSTWSVGTMLQHGTGRALVLMGTRDARQSPDALKAFNRQHLRPGVCSVLIDGADHGLQVNGQQWPMLWPLVTALVLSASPEAFDQACTAAGGVVSTHRSRP